MLCRIFRPIDWYHSLVPKKFFSGVIQDLGPFLESSFWHITRKRLFFSVYFRFWGPIIFQFPIRWPIHFFGGVDLFWKLFLLLEFILPVLLWVWRGQKKYISFEKRLTTMTTLLHEIFSPKLLLEKRLETEGHCRKLI